MKIDSFLVTHNNQRTIIIAMLHDYYVDFIFLPETGEKGDSVGFGYNMEVLLDESLLKLDSLPVMEFSSEWVTDTKEDNTHGYIKWDECSNWNFGGGNTMEHLCSIDDMDTIAYLVKECYIYTADNLDTWFGD